MNWSKQGRQPIIIHLTMGVQKNDNIAGRRHGAVVTRADQTLALLVAHNLDLGVVRVLGQVVQLLVQVLQLGLVVDEHDLVQELGRGTVEDAVYCTQQGGPT